MKKIILLIAYCMFAYANVSAAPIKEMIFFGDSLTDNGNLYRVLKVIPKSPPYYKGRFSNGPVWAEILGKYYHEQYNVNYQIYAVGGATVIRRGPVNGALPYFLREEIASYLRKSSSKDKANTMYIFMIGANDYLDEKRQKVDSLVTDVVNEIVAQIKVLIKKGGKSFLVFDLPDLTTAPYAKLQDKNRIQRLSILSKLHHEKLAEAVEKLKSDYSPLSFIFMDAYTLYNDIWENIEFYNQKYNKHIKNMTDACWSGGYTYKNRPILNEENIPEYHIHSILKSTSLSEVYSVTQAHTVGAVPCANPDDYIFWDQVHPSAVGHELLSSIMIEKLSATLQMRD